MDLVMSTSTLQPELVEADERRRELQNLLLGVEAEMKRLERS